MQQFDRRRIYESDASQIKAIPLKVFVPGSVSEITGIVKTNSSIIARGAGTGFCGGVVAQKENTTIIDMQRMNKILGLDERRRVVEVESGVILDDLNAFLEKYDLEFPVIPHSRKICTIGGMIANNSFGVFSAKYGSISRWIESIKIVNNLGVFEEKGKIEVSDFAGLEGTTGIIISAKLRVIEKKNRTFDVVKFSNIEKIKNLVLQLKLREDICMALFFDKKLSKLFNFGEFYTVILGYDSAQGAVKNREAEYLLREIFELYPRVLSEDYKIEDVRAFIDRSLEVFNWLESNGIPFFGDLGFGDLHPCMPKEKLAKADEMIKITKKHRGRINSGFGIGIKKKQHIEMLDKNLYLAVKKRNDPFNKFNAGKIIDMEEESGRS